MACAIISSSIRFKNNLTLQRLRRYLQWDIVQNVFLNGKINYT